MSRRRLFSRQGSMASQMGPGGREMISCCPADGDDESVDGLKRKLPVLPRSDDENQSTIGTRRRVSIPGHDLGSRRPFPFHFLSLAFCPPKALGATLPSLSPSLPRLSPKQTQKNHQSWHTRVSQRLGSPHTHPPIIIRVFHRLLVSRVQMHAYPHICIYRRSNGLNRCLSSAAAALHTHSLSSL